MTDFIKKVKKEKLKFNPKKNTVLNKDFNIDDESDMELVLYTKTGMGDGQQANNPWLQEFPDPITRVTWDNYLTISSFDAKRIGLKNINVANGALNGSFAKISDGESTLKDTSCNTTWSGKRVSWVSFRVWKKIRNSRRDANWRKRICFFQIF